MSTTRRKVVRPREEPRRQSLLRWVARYLRKAQKDVLLRFCTDKNSCAHKTFKRMHTKPKYYVLCTSLGNCTMQVNSVVTVDLTYIDIPDKKRG